MMPHTLLDTIFRWKTCNLIFYARKSYLKPYCSRLLPPPSHLYNIPIINNLLKEGRKAAEKDRIRLLQFFKVLVELATTS